MRTNGTLQEIFNQARAYQNGETGKPMNAVVRKFRGHEGAMWHIETGLYPESGATVECDLDVFQTFFYECPDNYTITDQDEENFCETFAIITEIGD